MDHSSTTLRNSSFRYFFSTILGACGKLVAMDVFSCLCTGLGSMLLLSASIYVQPLMCCAVLVTVVGEYYFSDKCSGWLISSFVMSRSESMEWSAICLLVLIRFSIHAFMRLWKSLSISISTVTITGVLAGCVIYVLLPASYLRVLKA